MIINNKYRKWIAVFVLFLISLLTFSTITNVFAADSDTIIETTFFGNLKDDGNGCGVYSILNLVVDILSIGVGIIGVIGIMVVGIQYLTAGGNEQQTTKAKRRMMEIVIGLVAFALLYTFTQWLTPGGKLNTTPCEKVSDEQLAEIKAAKEAARKAAREAANKGKTNKNSSVVGSNGLILGSQIADRYTPEKLAKLINQGKVAPFPVCTNCTWSERIAQTAELLAYKQGVSRSKYSYYGSVSGYPYKKWSDLKQGKPNEAHRKALDRLYPNHKFSSMQELGADCGYFVTLVLRYSGHDRGLERGRAEPYYENSKYWKKVKNNKIKRGDVCVGHFSNTATGFHIQIYLGDGKVATAQYTGKTFGHVQGGGCGGGYNIFRAV